MANPSPFEFFDTLYPGTPPAGRLPLYTTTLRAATERNYWCFNLRGADRLCAKYHNSRQVLFGPALHDPDIALAIAKTRRGSAVLGNIRGCDASVTALSALWVEIPYGNVAAGGSATHPIPPDLGHALSLLEAFPHRPSIVISGNGRVRALWLLDRPWVFDLKDKQASDKAEAIALLHRLWWAIALLAAERGWSIDASGDSSGAGQTCTLAAAFPMPDSPTGATAKGPRAILETFPLTAGGDRYRRRDFQSLPPAPAQSEQPWREALAPPVSVQPAPRIFPLRPIVRGCEWLRHCHTDRATLDARELKHAASLLRWCDAPSADSAKLIHTLYSGHPGYDRFDIDKKIAAALRLPGRPITCQRIATAPGVAERYCSACQHFGQIETPIQLAEGDGAGLGDEAPTHASANQRADTPEADTPEADTPETAKPRILITTRQHEVNDQALAALAAAGVLFEHAGALVEVVHPVGLAPTIRQIRAPRLRELLSRYCRFVAEKHGEVCAAYPPSWTTDALLARGSWPEVPSLEEKRAEGGFVEMPDPEIEVAAQAAEFLAGLAVLLASRGGAATARGITGALVAEAERFPRLATAFRRLIPTLEPGHPRAAVALGLCLRSIKGRAFGGRVLVEQRQTRDGIAWAVRPVPAVAPPA